jgi:hypothetical protein
MQRCESLLMTDPMVSMPRPICRDDWHKLERSSRMAGQKMNNFVKDPVHSLKCLEMTSYKGGPDA